MARQERRGNAPASGAAAAATPAKATAAKATPAKAAGAASDVHASLPGSRADLLALHADWRRRRDAAPLGSPAYVEACDQIGRIEVEVARIERTMDPPRV
jgi:hypothetical protein